MVCLCCAGGCCVGPSSIRLSRGEGVTLREVTRQLRERLREPARQATLLGRALPLLDMRNNPAPADRDLFDLTVAIVRSLQEHGRSHEPAACNGCAALATLSCNELADGTSPVEKAGVGATLAAMRAFPRNAELQAHACITIGNLCGTLPSAELIATGGPIDAIAAALLSAGESAEPGKTIDWQTAKRCASRALADCCRGRPEAAERAHQLGAASAVLAALRAAADPFNAATHCSTLGCLALAIGDSRVSLALLSEGAAEAIAEALRAQPLHADLQCYGLYALMTLLFAKGGEGVRRAIEAGAAELAVAALRAEGRMLFPGSEARSVGATQDKLRVNALFVLSYVPPPEGAAVAQAVTEVMIAHAEHEATQQQACLVLDNIAYLQQEREAASAAGAPEAIVRALRRFPEGKPIIGSCSAGWHALAEMSITADSSLLPAVTAGGVEAACDGLQRHLAGGEEERIIVDVVRSLANLLFASHTLGDKAAACTLERRAVAAGCAELLVSTARKFPENGELAFHAAVSLGFLSAAAPACAERVAEAGGVEVACAALRHVRENAERVKLCTTAINNVSSSSLTGAERAREAGALELLAEATQSFPEEESLQTNCNHAIRSLVRNDRESMRRAKEMGFEFAEEEDFAAPAAASTAAPAAAAPLGPVVTIAAAQPAAAAASSSDGAESPEAPATTSAAARPAGGGAEQHSPRSPRRACHNCGVKAGGSDPLGEPVRKLSLCGGCRGVRYCSEACNREAWPSHKAACRRTQTEAAAAAASAALATASLRDGQ